MAVRAATAAALIPIAVGSAWLGGVYFTVAVALVVGLAIWELRAMAFKAGWGFATIPGFVLAVALVFRAIAAPGVLARFDLALILAAAFSLALRLLWPGRDRGFAGWAVAVAGAMYAGGLASFFPYLRELPDGFAWVALAFAATWAYDVGAYSAGTLVGRHAFMCHVSPNKTWEGLGGGLLGATAAVAAFVPFLPIDARLIPVAAALFALAAQTGDLVESALKREAGIKDSGTVFPGHGGILDRVDSLLFAGPAVYAFAFLVTGYGPFA